MQNNNRRDNRGRDKLVYCDIVVTNSYGKVRVFHHRVPADHVKWLDIADHLHVKVVKTYTVDRGFRRYSNKPNRFRSNKSD